ncbi:MAG: polyprenyl synthetase family protein [Azospirillaceae bacterium]
MDATSRIERALDQAMSCADGPSAPPRLLEAMRHAVFPKGARVRPRLCLSVAEACGDDEPGIADGAAAAIELLHCASLVHDDLPCFDDADTRRGKPSVQRAYGAPMALLAGDALIVLAFETLARTAVPAPARLAPLVLTIGRSVGTPAGLCAGQAWEGEKGVVVADYQRLKTGSLFVAATVAGAAAAGADPAPWRALGETLGEAYQVADDLRDVAGDAEELGKPVGQDALHGRPSSVTELGVDGAMDHLEDLVVGAIAAIPDCPGAGMLETLIRSEAKRLVPKSLARSAA